jgi:signal transduction histidine kinase
VISCFARLSAEVSHIGASGDHALRATISGTDELSQLAGAINKMLDSLQRSQEELRNLSAHLEFLREEERAGMAREIHDELGQVLSTLKMDLGALENHFPKDQKILFEITQSMSGLIYLTIQRVKRISQELRPSVLDHLTFPQAVTWQVDEFTKKSGIPCRLSITDEDNLKLTREVSNALFRVLQETLTNVIRHAEATQVSVDLEKTNAHVVLKVRDNGKGMTHKEMTDPRCFGLIGMRERVHHLKGNLKIVSNFRQGTTIIASVPLTNAERSLT